MPSTKEIRRRIKSVKNTAQITKAMQMVSAAKMRKAQNQALSSRPYSATLVYALKVIAEKLNALSHPLLESNSSSKIGILMLSTNKGLCGSLNTNLFRLLQDESLGKEIIMYTVGKKGRDFVVRTNKSLGADFESLERVDFSLAIQIRKFLLEAFLKAEVSKVYLLYPQFVSTLKQEPKLVSLLPIDENSFAHILTEEVKDEDNNNSEFLFEPNTEAVLDYTLTHFLDTQIYQALLETRASEHSATMIAMKNATDNAKDLVSDLSLTYNQMRQNAVTSELLEITSAQSALEG